MHYTTDLKTNDKKNIFIAVMAIILSVFLLIMLNLIIKYQYMRSEVTQVELEQYSSSIMEPATFMIEFYTESDIFYIEKKAEGMYTVTSENSPEWIVRDTYLNATRVVEELSTN